MNEANFHFSFQAFGTQLQIQIWDSLAELEKEKIRMEILNYTNYFNETYSRFKENSLVTKISKSSGKFVVPKEFVEILKIYQQFNKITNASMNPLIGNTISDLGYDKSYTLTKNETIRPTPDFNKTLIILSDSEIQLNEPVLIDIGAIGKGFWVDKISELLNKHNLQKFFVDGSGDIFFKNTFDDEKLKVGIEYIPEIFDNKRRELLGYAEIFNEAICGSGIQKRNWSIKKEDNLHHVLDANTNLPTTNILSVWVKTKKCCEADALSTALFFTKPEEILGIDFQYFLINKLEVIEKSKGFNLKLVNE